jgi:hypothetical protein
VANVSAELREPRAIGRQYFDTGLACARDYGFDTRIGSSVFGVQAAYAGHVRSE